MFGQIRLEELYVTTSDGIPVANRMDAAVLVCVKTAAIMSAVIALGPLAEEDYMRLFPCSNHFCKKHEEHAIRFVTDGSCGVPAQDNQLLAKKRVSATSSNLFLARSISVPTMREVAVSGLVQFLNWW